MEKSLAIKLSAVWVFVIALVTAAYFFLPKFISDKNIISSNSENQDVTNLDNQAEFEGIVPNETAGFKEGATEKELLANSKNPKDPNDITQNFNILILGIDRRYADQADWRADVIQLLTLSPDRKNAVITHIPRDVWAGSYKINAVYKLKGPDAMKDIIEEVTGQRPDRVIRIDFDAFVWAIDGIGGITVNVPMAFVDNSYPNDRQGENVPITVEFEAGEQVMDGETALIYARSRKGTNGEGSDYARGTRQQIIMEAATKAYFNPGNLFTPKTAETLYKIATEKIYTDLSLKDTEILFEIVKNHANIHVEKLRLDTTNYLVSPADKTLYGGQWTLIAKDNDYLPIHEEINSLLN